MGGLVTGILAGCKGDFKFSVRSERKNVISVRCAFVCVFVMCVSLVLGGPRSAGHKKPRFIFGYVMVGALWSWFLTNALCLCIFNLVAIVVGLENKIWSELAREVERVLLKTNLNAHSMWGYMLCRTILGLTLGIHTNFCASIGTFIETKIAHAGETKMPIS